MILDTTSISESQRFKIRRKKWVKSINLTKKCILHQENYRPLNQFVEISNTFTILQEHSKDITQMQPIWAHVCQHVLPLFQDKRTSYAIPKLNVKRVKMPQKRRKNFDKNVSKQIYYPHIGYQTSPPYFIQGETLIQISSVYHFKTTSDKLFKNYQILSVNESIM